MHRIEPFNATVLPLREHETSTAWSMMGAICRA